MHVFPAPPPSPGRGEWRGIQEGEKSTPGNGVGGRAGGEEGDEERGAAGRGRWCGAGGRKETGGTEDGHIVQPYARKRECEKTRRTRPRARTELQVVDAPDYA